MVRQPSFLVPGLGGLKLRAWRPAPLTCILYNVGSSRINPEVHRFDQGTALLLARQDSSTRRAKFDRTLRLM